MTILSIWLIGACSILFISTAVLIIILRGVFKTQTMNIDEYKRYHLTGREIEEMKRRVLQVGLQDITIADVLNLIYVIRSIQLGQYSDLDPYVPADPYDGFDTIDDFDRETTKV